MLDCYNHFHDTKTHTHTRTHTGLADLSRADFNH